MPEIGGSLTPHNGGVTQTTKALGKTSEAKKGLAQIPKEQREGSREGHMLLAWGKKKTTVSITCKNNESKTMVPSTSWVNHLCGVKTSLGRSCRAITWCLTHTRAAASLYGHGVLQ